MRNYGELAVKNEGEEKSAHEFHDTISLFLKKALHFFAACCRCENQLIDQTVSYESGY